MIRNTLTHPVYWIGVVMALSIGGLVYQLHENNERSKTDNYVVACLEPKSGGVAFASDKIASYKIKDSGIIFYLSNQRQVVISNFPCVVTEKQ